MKKIFLIFLLILFTIEVNAKDKFLSLKKIKLMLGMVQDSITL